MISKHKAEHLARIEKAASWLKKNLKGLTPDTLMIMGSGLSKSAPDLKNSVTIPFEKIPGFLRSTVEGHAGELEVGKCGKLTVAIMKGRFHYYEGHDMSDLAIPIRTFWKIGVKNLVVTAAVGSVHKNVKPGSFVILNDHINFMGMHPLRGVHDKQFGPMFPDVSTVYTPALRKAALAACKKNKIPAREGVYLAGFGPTYETPTEIRMFKSWGADVVGMSTVPEVLVASQLGLRVVGVTCVTNLAAGISPTPLTHQEVLDAGEMIAKKFKGFSTDLLNSPAFEVK